MIQRFWGAVIGFAGIACRCATARATARSLWVAVAAALAPTRSAPPLQASAPRYFVIHDTSGPNFGGRSFPADINVSPKINNLRLFFCPDGWGRSHVVINRSGRMIVDHDFEIPWRETKFERAPRFAGAL